MFPSHDPLVLSYKAVSVVPTSKLPLESIRMASVGVMSVFFATVEAGSVKNRMSPLPTAIADFAHAVLIEEATPFAVPVYK